jgi:hypothetical protein
MKRKYHAIPIIIYAPVDVYPNVTDVYGVIKTSLDMEAPDLSVFFAEDYADGLIEIDPVETELSGMISIDCDHIELFKAHLKAIETLKN